MSRRAPFAPALVAGAAVLLLAGCSAAIAAGGSTGTPSTPPPSAAASPSASSTPGAVPSIDPSDAARALAVLPSDFPPTIPLIDGDILTSASTATGWVVWVRSSEPIADYGQAASALEDAGFTASADQGIAGAAGGVFSDAQYTITVSAGTGAAYPDAVGYQVVRR